MRAAGLSKHNAVSRRLLWVACVLAVVGMSACRGSNKAASNRARAAASVQPRVDRFNQIKAAPATAPVDQPEHPTRTAVDDLPCHATATWLRDVLPAEEAAADWERPLDKWTRERAVALLLTADRVRGPAVGAKGRIAPQVWATVELSRQPDVLCASAWILKRAPLPGRIYALAALWLADRPHFEALSVDYSELPAPVPVTFGLVEGQARAADLVARIRSGELPEAWRSATEPLSAEDDEEPTATP